jgi:capsular polysaccharide biosynthesis protein
LDQEILCEESVAVRKLPANFEQADFGLFGHELKRVITATVLRRLEGITVHPAGILFRGSEVLPESFPSPHYLDAWSGSGDELKARIKNDLLKAHRRLERDAVWVTDIWSQGYFHWMTDALPRLFTMRGRMGDAPLLLPGAYAGERYIKSSLKPFFVEEIKFIHQPLHCASLRMPTHTAPSGNYNESLIRGLRSLYTDFYREARGGGAGDKIYVSRGKAQRRKVVNEEECVTVLGRYGFKTVYFEDHSFEQQAKIALDARYIISIHGAGLTNLLFMRPGGSVLELRQNGDALNNCYFSLASASGLEYFYQLCRSKNPGEDAHTADLIVDCRLLRKNVELMLAG